jgi:hypothetical protein
MRHNSFQSDFIRDVNFSNIECIHNVITCLLSFQAEYLRRLKALRPDQPAYL